jgi:glycosyltransferase involved in cell wall biosynthesis
MEISIVVPISNEAENIPSLYTLLQEAMDVLPRTIEVIFVDDGSTDDSSSALDGQNDPRDIPRLLGKLDEGFDLVSGWRREREDKALSRRLPSVIANRLISRLMRIPLHDYGCTLKAYRRDVIEDVRLYGEMHRFIPVFAYWEGARVTEVVVQHHARKLGRSKYGLGRVIRVLPSIWSGTASVKSHSTTALRRDSLSSRRIFPAERPAGLGSRRCHPPRSSRSIEDR